MFSILSASLWQLHTYTKCKNILFQDLKTRDATMMLDSAFAVVDLSETGLTQFAEIIRPPQSFILTVGSPRHSLSESDSILHLATITLSCDGSKINENDASKFLDVFKRIIENPTAYL